MAASFPSSTKSFSTKLTGDVIASAHVNDIQNEVVAVENDLLVGIAHTLIPDANNTRDLGSSAKKWATVYTTALSVNGATIQAPVMQTTTSTGTVNDFALTTGANVLRCNNATALTITGFSAGTDGQSLIVVSIGAGQVDLSHQAAGSTAANRVINFATTSVTSLAAGVGWAQYVYDATTARWRLVSHEQGAWITPTYDATKWTASAGTWTVDSGDILADKYWLKGRSLFFQITVATTSVSATPATLSRSLYGFTAVATRFDGFAMSSDAGAANGLGQFNVPASGTTVAFLKSAGNWSAAVNNTTILSQGFAEVQ